MLEEFIDFCTEVFPSINPYTVENVKSAMAQFQHEGKTFSVCRSSPLDYLAQGDIFSELPFTFLIVMDVKNWFISRQYCCQILVMQVDAIIYYLQLFLILKQNLLPNAKHYLLKRLKISNLIVLIVFCIYHVPSWSGKLLILN